MAELVTLQELKDALGITDNSEDAKLQDALRDASAAIRSYTDRSFNTTQATSTKIFQYDGSGVLEIEDAVAVTNVSMDGVTLVLGTDYTVEPYGNAVFNWLFLPVDYPLGGSPEMGFTRNLDRLWWKRSVKPIRSVSVTGTWGWPSIPDDVQRAALWTAAAFAETPRPVIQERTADVSRTYTNISAAIPSRAKDLLEPYVRGRQ